MHLLSAPTAQSPHAQEGISECIFFLPCGTRPAVFFLLPKTGAFSECHCASGECGYDKVTKGLLMGNSVLVSAEEVTQTLLQLPDDGTPPKDVFGLAQWAACG